MSNSQIKIGFLCGSKAWGGLEMNQLKNALWFKEYTYEVVVLCKENSPIQEQCKIENISVIIISEHRRYKYFVAGISFAKLISNNNITHLFTRDSKDLNICSIAKTFSKKKFHLSYFMEMQLGVSKRNFLHTARYRKIDVWFCSLPYLKDQVLKYTRFPARKIEILPSAIKLSEKKLNKSETRKKLNFSENSFICGIVGRIDQYKGQLDVVKAIHEINHPEIQLCIIGSPTKNEKNDYFNEILTFINENKLETKVFIFPHQENVEQLFTTFDVTIMASKSETFGMVTIESLANGIPVIGTNSGGTPEILKNEKYGILIQPSDINQLKIAIINVFSNKITFDSLELKAYASKFDYKKIIPKIIKKVFF